MFEDTPGVDITGSGTAQNPYRINVRQLHVGVADSATIDMTLTGTGSETNPYTIKADFIGVINPPDWTPSETQFWSGAVNLSSVTAPRTIRATLNGNVTGVTMPTWGSSDSGSITLMLSQDATGGRTWVMPGTSALGVKVALTPTAGARDLIVMFWTGSQWVCIPSAMDVK